MAKPRNYWLLVAAGLNAFAALLHLGCIVFGAPWYRFLGAGERTARMAEAGHWLPIFVTLLLAGILTVWSLYALSGAGVIRRLPLLRPVLIAITGFYLLRGLGFVLLMPAFPGYSMTFWYVSSGTCLLFGLVHAGGLRAAWPMLTQTGA